MRCWKDGIQQIQDQLHLLSKAEPRRPPRSCEEVAVRTMEQGMVAAGSESRGRAQDWRQGLGTGARGTFAGTNCSAGPPEAPGVCGGSAFSADPGPMPSPRHYLRKVAVTRPMERGSSFLWALYSLLSAAHTHLANTALCGRSSVPVGGIKGPKGQGPPQCGLCIEPRACPRARIPFADVDRLPLSISLSLCLIPDKISETGFFTGTGPDGN